VRPKAATAPNSSQEAMAACSGRVATLSGSSSDTVDFNRSFWTTLSENARFVWHSDQIGRMEYPSPALSSVSRSASGAPGR